MPGRIDRYELRGELGRGGMGVVYRAVDPRAGEQVALKVLTAGRDAPERARRRFAREAEALRKLRHPNVVRLRDAGEHEGCPYLVMDYHADGTLQDVLEERGPLSPNLVARIGVALAAGLDAAHAVEVLHRDLKPDNVLLDPRGNPLLTDFGLARSLDPEGESSKLTKRGMVVGTPGFWAPEQTTGEVERHGPRTDVYGLGATLYCALSGRPPAEGEGLVELLVATTSEPPPPLRELRPEVPPALAAIVHRCLEKRPEDRWPSAAALRSALSDHLAGRDDPAWTAAAAPAAPEAARSWGPAWLALLAPGLLAIGLGIGVFAANLAAPSLPAAPPAPASPSSAPSAEVARPAPRPPNPQLDDYQRAVQLIGGRKGDDHVDAGIALLERGASRRHLRSMRRLILELDQLGDRVGATAWLWRLLLVTHQSLAQTLHDLQYGLPRTEHDRTAAEELLRPAATAGHVPAMVALGLLRESPAPEEARRWYRRAATEGDPAGHAYLAVLLVRGKGGQVETATGLKHARIAIEAGHPTGMVLLGSMLFDGDGVPRDEARAVALFRRAARLEHPAGALGLGMAYASGRGVPHDGYQAAAWLEAAKASTDPRIREQAQRVLNLGKR